MRPGTGTGDGGRVWALAVALGVAACGRAPQVTITAPTEGETVTAPVRVTLGVMNVELAPAAENRPGTAHHHLFLDADVTPLDASISRIPASPVTKMRPFATAMLASPVVSIPVASVETAPVATSMRSTAPSVGCQPPSEVIATTLDGVSTATSTTRSIELGGSGSLIAVSVVSAASSLQIRPSQTVGAPSYG